MLRNICKVGFKPLLSQTAANIRCPIKGQLEEYIKAYPKITLVRAPERVGLIRCGRNVLALRLVNMHDDP